ncbi:MAG TPA: TonB-dependent receptor [Solimonas sp.]|nr:TonB-dependent receptor [Solimonas sp.]
MLKKPTMRGTGMAPLMALMIGGCLLAAMPQSALAQEQPAAPAETQGSETSEDLLLEDLLDSTEPAESPEAAAPAAAPEASPAAPPANASKDDEILPTIAIEQKATPTPTLKAPPSHPQIEEVVVTATKRSENVRDIPASITALSGEELEQRGAQDTADIVKLVPGVNLTSTGDTPPRVTIRGISSDIGTSSTTGILFGNVSFSEAFAPVVALDPNPFDMASVEILKGPQGTLYGASALNGAVRYVPAPPKFGEYELKYFGQYTSIKGGDAAPTYGAAVNVPLYEDSLALRVMAFDRTAPGFIDNTRIPYEDTNRTDQKGGRILLGWRPGEAWDILLTGAYQSTDYRDTGIADNDEGRLETFDRPRRSPNHVEYSFADLSLSYTGDWAQFVSDTSYIKKNGHNFFDASSRSTGSGDLAVIAQEYTGESITYGQEFRLASIDDPDSNWKWVAGLFAWQQGLENTLTVPLAVDLAPLADILEALQLTPLSSLFSASGSPLVLQGAADVKVKELAAFGEVTRKLGYDVEVTLGGRLYRTVSGGKNVESGVFFLAQTGESPHVNEGEIAERGFNPKASITWHYNGEILAYGSISKGFRVGGIQTGATTPVSQNAAPKTYKSDFLWNYEIGVRTQFLENTLRVDLTGFWVDWKDPQSLQPDASGLAVYLDNVGGVQSKGLDLSVQYLMPWAGMMLTSGVSYADTVTTEDFTTADGTVYPTGSNWPLAPQWQSATNLSFMYPLGNWAVGGYATYTTIGTTVPVFGAHEIFGYQQVDLQLSVSNEKLKWLPQVALILNNLTDERGLTNAFTSGVPSDDLAAEEYYYITPRSVTLRFMGRFGE